MNEYARCLTTRYGHQMTSRSNCNWKSRPGMEQKSWRIGYQSSRHPVTLNLVVSYIISLSNQLVGYKSRPTTISRVISLPPCEEEESTISVIRMEVNYFWTHAIIDDCVLFCAGVVGPCWCLEVVGLCSTPDKRRISKVREVTFLHLTCLIPPVCFFTLCSACGWLMWLNMLR